MVDALVDTSVIIDLIRLYPPAVQWISNQKINLGVCEIVWMEVIQGATNKTDQQKAIKILNRFARVEVEKADIQWAGQSLIIFRLSHNIIAFDALIAATAHRLQVPIYTRNVKHFTPMLGNSAQLPY